MLLKLFKILYMLKLFNLYVKNVKINQMSLK